MQSHKSVTFSSSEVLFSVYEDKESPHGCGAYQRLKSSLCAEGSLL